MSEAAAGPSGARGWRARLARLPRLRPPTIALFRTTTFRLALAQALVFILFAAALLAAVYFTTAGQLTEEAETAVDQEFAALSRIHAAEGEPRLNEEIIERVERSGLFLYLLADAQGRPISGHFDKLDRIPQGTTPEEVQFPFQSLDATGQAALRRARGVVARLPDGAILLVARDMGDADAIVRRITASVWIGAGLGLAFSLVAGVTASRQAARRAEALSRTARDVMGGDLSRRAPTWGAGDEFDALAEDLNAMLERLERLVHSSRTAGDAIAHDLRTPLSRMRQRLDAALSRAPDSGADREALEKAVAECDQVLATFNAILRLARVQSAEGWAFQRLNLANVIEDLAELYTPAAEEAGVALVVATAPELIMRGDMSLLTQAVANLLDNAIKYTPAGGRIALIGAQLPDRRIEVAVADTGPGIPAPLRERAQDRFYRLEAARTSPGAGLGLSLVAAVAQLHRGSIALSDGLGGPPGPGLRVSVAFPAG